jgi:hypothetical protein
MSAENLTPLEVLALEMRAGFAETRASLAELRTLIIELRADVRNLWTEHLGHYHPEEQ